ncbi:helix-turn-helix transcriptional regulator [Billgrantia saliphila]|uniref:helix-turn-helix transcriptional regulator n=1 Tax=Billgrantia saliphila TaxID=1848458 RepID=UPI0018CC1B63|nr:AraC family transcriptional regulator [Halomonas saliphila]
MSAPSPLYVCHSSTDWFALSAHHDAFRLRWDQPEGRGWEACYRLAPGLWLRTLDLEQASGCLPAWIPGGHLTLAGMLEGATALESPEGEAFELAGDRLLCSHRRQGAAFLDRCLEPGRYLMALLILDPERLRQPPFGLTADDLAAFNPGVDGNRCLPLDAPLRRCLKELTSPPVDQRRLPLYLQAKCSEFLCLLLSSRTLAPPRARIGVRDLQALEEARRRLLADLTRPPRLAELSRGIGMSESRLKQRFKEHHGQTLSDCLRQARMCEAERLLDDDLPIARIATDLGYEHAANFTTAFKREFGLTPRDYRRLRRLNH